MASINGSVDLNYADSITERVNREGMPASKRTPNIRNNPYITVSKGKEYTTDSLCKYCCWNMLEFIKAFILPTFYTITVVLCVIYCWQIVENFIKSRQNPIETLSYQHTDSYENPGIAVFMYNSSYINCSMVYAYDEELPYGPMPTFGSQYRRREKRGGLGSLLYTKFEPDTKPCEFTAISQYHSKTARRNSSIMVFKGPSNVLRREYMKIHFTLDSDDLSLKFGFMEFFPFYNFSDWVASGSSMAYLQEREKLQDIWPLALGFMTYSRLAIRVFETESRFTHENHTLFTPVNDIVKYVGDDPSNYTPTYENMYAIFEWKEAEYEIVKQVVTQSLWTTVGLFVTAILTILRMMDLTKVIVRRQKVRAQQERISCYGIFRKCCNCCRCNCCRDDQDSMQGSDVAYIAVNS